MNTISRRGFFTKAIAGALALLCPRAWARPARATYPGDLAPIPAGPGEIIRLLDGHKHGYESVSLIFSETAPGGGPPLHTHDCEEVHVVDAGRVAYWLNEERFTLEGPFVLRIPAKTPHAFLNAGQAPLKITAVFGSPRYTFHFLGPNPLATSAKTEAKAAP